ncbi:hypothetical protein ACWD26_33790 [Streptomyces sp. NPDC002787]
MNTATWGKANFPLKDGRFVDELKAAPPKKDGRALIPFNPAALTGTARPTEPGQGGFPHPSAVLPLPQARQRGTSSNGSSTE